MAEIIDFAEIQEARRKARARIPERENLERAVQLMRENLAAVAAELADAPREEQAELLTRVERLAAMIRYGMRMLGLVPLAAEWARGFAVRDIFAARLSSPRKFGISGKWSLTRRARMHSARGFAHRGQGNSISGRRADA